MGAEQSLCHTSGLEECEAQQRCVAHARPDGHADVIVRGNVLHQNRIDATQTTIRNAWNPKANRERK